MLSDENAEFGPQTQTQTQTQSEPLSLGDSPRSSEDTPDAQVVGGEGPTDAFCVLAKTADDSAKSEILLTDSQLQQSPQSSPNKSPPEIDEVPGTRDATNEQMQDDTDKTTMVPEETPFADGHDDPEVIVIDQECLDSFVAKQRDYATTMDDRAMALLASHPSYQTETQYKLAQFYGEEDADGNPVYSEEARSILADSTSIM